MTQMLFRQDAYRREAPALVTGHTDEGGLVLNQSVFYATGGGQPGDSGVILWEGRRLPIATAVKGEGADIILVPAEPASLPPVGAEVQQRLDWDRRYRHMRIHTALHLLSVVIPLPVTGGSIGAAKGRLDFDMPEGEVDRELLGQELNALIDQDHPVSEHWITDEELAAQPDLVKTMSVRPPVGAGRVRLIRIGPQEAQVDLQPCGGTHVARLGEIGRIRVGKVENKGRRNRRINLHLDE
jgi:misacylated tRNA(Ala) deacylase